MLGVCEIRHLVGERLPGAHSHTGAHQMVLVCRGEPMVCIDGVRYTASAPCVIVISRLEQHSWHLPGEEYERYTVNLDPDALCSGEELRLMSVFTHRPESFCHVLPLDDEAASRLTQLLSFAEEEAARGEDAFPRAADDLVRAALLYLLRRYPDRFPEDNESQAALITAVRRTIEQRLCDELTLGALAQQFHLNPYYLAHRFKAVTGYSVKNYQLRCRVAAARTLLESTDLRVSEICERVGFSDVSSLSRYFRREVGLTPTRYRAANR